MKGYTVLEGRFLIGSKCLFLVVILLVSLGTSLCGAESLIEFKQLNTFERTISFSHEEQYKTISWEYSLLRKQLDILLVLDVSISMNDEEKIFMEKQLSEKVISLLDENSAVSIVSFATSPKSLSDFSYSHQELIDDIIKKLEPRGLKKGEDGYSDIGEALLYAIGLAEKNDNYTVIIVITDGIEKGEEFPVSDICEAVTKQESPILTYILSRAEIDETISWTECLTQTGGFAHLMDSRKDVAVEVTDFAHFLKRLQTSELKVYVESSDNVEILSNEMSPEPLEFSAHRVVWVLNLGEQGKEIHFQTKIWKPEKSGEMKLITISYELISDIDEEEEPNVFAEIIGDVEIESRFGKIESWIKEFLLKHQKKLVIPGIIVLLLIISHVFYHQRSRKLKMIEAQERAKFENLGYHELFKETLDFKGKIDYVDIKNECGFTDKNKAMLYFHFFREKIREEPDFDDLYIMRKAGIEKKTGE